VDGPGSAESQQVPRFGPPPEELARLIAGAQRREPFPIINQLLVAGLTAALVVALGIIFLTRSDDGKAATAAAAPPPAPTETAATKAAPPPVAVPAVPTPTPPAPATTPAHSPNMPDPSELSDQLGYLMVKGPEEADVYLNGLRKGAANETLLVPCGRFFMRLAQQGTRGPFPEWLTRGETAYVACKSSTVLTAKLIADEAGPPPRRPRKGFL